MGIHDLSAEGQRRIGAESGVVQEEHDRNKKIDVEIESFCMACGSRTKKQTKACAMRALFIEAHLLVATNFVFMSETKE